MREQLPLRPAEFVKIRDGYIAFLKRPAGMALTAIIPASVLDAMASAARRGRNSRRLIDVLRLASALVAAMGITLIVAPDPIRTGIGVALLLGGGAAFILAHFRSKVRREPQIEELISEANEALERDLRALDLFRGQIASGDIPTAQLLPDGAFKPLSPNALQAFLADHGALLVVSRDQDLWQCVPHRPIPMSELWVKLGARMAPALVTSRTLLDTADRELFDRRTAWLLAHAVETNQRANAFREAIQIIIALRRPELDGMTFERKKEILRKEGVGDSRMEKIHAGVYPAFNNYLRQLPMHEFP